MVMPDSADAGEITPLREAVAAAVAFFGVSSTFTGLAGALLLGEADSGGTEFSTGLDAATGFTAAGAGRSAGLAGATGGATLATAVLTTGLAAGFAAAGLAA